MEFRAEGFVVVDLDTVCLYLLEGLPVGGT